MSTEASPVNPEAVREFCDRADRLEVNGLDFQHIAICERRCWLHAHRASMNEHSEIIRLGAVRHADSHTRDRSTTGLLGLNPDRLDWTNSVVVEEKASTSHIAATGDQAAFYAAMMTGATGRVWSVKIYVSAARRYRDVVLDGDRLRRLEKALDRIEELKRSQLVPAAQRVKACAGCSNNEFCGFSG